MYTRRYDSKKGYLGFKKLLTAISSYVIVILFFALYWVLYSFYSENTIFAATSAGCGVYTGGGDWIITDNCYVWSETIPVSGNIYIKNGGSLYLGYDGSSTSSAKLVFRGFKYRKPISLDNTGNSALGGYPIKIVIDTSSLISAGKMNSDCSDIRFAWYNSSDSTYKGIPYWIESGCNSANTVIWVKVPEIYANSVTSLYLYYGNTTPVKSESNGDAVFEFFDDFNNGMSKWNNFGSPTPGTFQNSAFHDDWGYATNGDGSYSSGSYSKALIDVIGRELAVRFRVKQDAGSTWDMFYNIGMGAAQSGYSETNIPVYFSVGIMGDNPDGHSENSRNIYYKASGSTTYTQSGANDLNFHVYEIVYSYYNDNVKFYKDGSLVTTLSINSPPYSSLPLLINGRDYRNTNYLDWILVRKYSSTEPTVSIGSEQTGWSQYIYIYSGGTLYVYSGSSID